MKVREILRQKGMTVVTVEPDDSVQDAIHRLVQHNIGSLVVRMPDGRIAGIITERDILRESARRPGQLARTRVGEVMTTELIICLPDDELEYVMGIMTKNRIRHLPILDDGGLQGIISIGDVVNAHLREAEFENRMLKDYITGRAS